MRVVPQLFNHVFLYQFILDKVSKRTPEFMPAFAAMHAFKPAAGPSPGGKGAAKPSSTSFFQALPATALLSKKPSVTGHSAQHPHGATQAPVMSPGKPAASNTMCS
jgi:hypothetical protein